jgi:hypothetical protein
MYSGGVCEAFGKSGNLLGGFEDNDVIGLVHSIYVRGIMVSGMSKRHTIPVEAERD